MRRLERFGKVGKCCLLPSSFLLSSFLPSLYNVFLLYRRIYFFEAQYRNYSRSPENSSSCRKTVSSSFRLSGKEQIGWLDGAKTVEFSNFVRKIQLFQNSKKALWKNFQDGTMFIFLKHDILFLIKMKKKWTIHRILTGKALHEKASFVYSLKLVSMNPYKNVFAERLFIVYSFQIHQESCLCWTLIFKTKLF